MHTTNKTVCKAKIANILKMRFFEIVSDVTELADINERIPTDTQN
jgi:hypothetical protein